jgi:hypothetical protein
MNQLKKVKHILFWHRVSIYKVRHKNPKKTRENSSREPKNLWLSLIIIIVKVQKIYTLYIGKTSSKTSTTKNGSTYDLAQRQASILGPCALEAKPHAT